MLLRRLQELLGGIYDVELGHDVYDFLVTDRRRLPEAVRAESNDEQLIIEQDGADPQELGLGLYLDPALLARLEREDPTVRLHHGNVADWLTALEGVSHFVYLVWNAGHDRPVSLLELEMQAEVDKYVASWWLLRRQEPEHFPTELHRALFERTRIDPQRAAGRVELYREASRYAGRFCRGLGERLRHESRDGEVLTELRRFYRLSNARKRVHIERSSL